MHICERLTATAAVLHDTERCAWKVVSGKLCKYAHRPSQYIHRSVISGFYQRAKMKLVFHNAPRSVLDLPGGWGGFTPSLGGPTPVGGVAKMYIGGVEYDPAPRARCPLFTM